METLNRDVLSLIFDFTFWKSGNVIQSLVCKNWRNNFGKPLLHVRDCIDNEDMVIFCCAVQSGLACDTEDCMILILRKALRFLAMTNDRTEFKRVLKWLLRIDNCVDFADEFLYAATKHRNYEIVKTFYEAEYAPIDNCLHENVTIDVLCPFEVGYRTQTWTFTIPKFVSSNHHFKDTTTFVFLNDVPVVGWYRRNDAMGWTKTAAYAYIEYIKCEFTGETKPAYLSAYVEKPPVLSFNHGKNLAWVMSTTKQQHEGYNSAEIRMGCLLEMKMNMPHSFHFGCY